MININELSTPNYVQDAADAYLSSADANAYFSTKMYTRFWDNASEDLRRKACVEATRILDRLAYIGIKSDPAQIHQWPRKIYLDNQTFKDLGIPQGFLDANCEIILALLSGVDPQKEFENLRKHQETFLSVKVSYDSSIIPEHITAGVPSFTAWQLIRQYLKSATEFKINRV